MINIDKAIEIFHDKIKGEYIGSIYDVGHSFIISSVDEEGEYLDTPAIIINKSTGEISTVLQDDEFENAKKIDYTEIKRS